jgi:hypothetical protein
MSRQLVDDDYAVHIIDAARALCARRSTARGERVEVSHDADLRYVHGLLALRLGDDTFAGRRSMAAAALSGSQSDLLSDLAAGLQRDTGSDDEAVRESPTSLPGMIRRGEALLLLARPEEARRQFEAVLAIDSGHPQAHIGIARASQALGDDALAWKEFAHYRPECYGRSCEQPIWDGSRLDGRTILVWSDQGLGDTIQYLRYIPLLVERGARVIVQCRANIVSLIACVAGVSHVVAFGAPVPDFDMHAPFFALPRVFNRLGVGIPSGVPYLSAPPDLAIRWRERLRQRPKKVVGLVWAGETTWHAARFKRVPFETLASLVRVRGCRFVSLQLGPHAADVIVPPTGPRVEEVLSESCTVAETAAIVHTLDLVISVDTLVAHLAGALGRPTWLLLHHGADSRWLAQHRIVPWYPTIRLYRQTTTGDWSSILQRVARDVDSLA